MKKKGNLYTQLRRMLLLLAFLCLLIKLYALAGVDKLPDRVHASNFEMKCEYGGNPMCCAALDSPVNQHAKSVHVPSKERHHRETCIVTKTYVPSPYEKRQYATALKINALEKETSRRDAYIKYFLSDKDIKDSKIWLERVRVHTQSGDGPTITKDDIEYLSRFEVNRTCSYINNSGISKTDTNVWTEWIEPISMHARHPFSFYHCGHLNNTYEMDKLYSAKNLHHTALINSDYILVQGSKGQYGNNSNSLGIRSNKQVKHFLLDAGTSSFETSLYWFICSYLQRDMKFDSIYGWELTEMNPVRFWSKVPPLLKAIYHFFNVPITVSADDADSPLHLIKQMASVDDFVTFKLDIDTPSVELPILKTILTNPDVSKLIDEFFFELHFRCEIMMYCGWGVHIPETDHNLLLDRPHTMNLFHQLRVLGIRAHIWP